MRKFILLLSVSFLSTSCTYEDVVNYLMGKDNNLNQEQREQANKEYSSGNTSNYAQTATEVDKDRGGGRP
ncbi:hypothetical protein [Flavobacterium davisii]|uniref:hypothetical protein n=1 Tax=Flavobacterium davisii TaxID=2906077 RepID=UPI000F4DA892|nr:hypothetical protein [Flavobacterium davisii]